jgi:DNA mismatch repair ATPase MutS
MSGGDGGTYILSLLPPHLSNTHIHTHTHTHTHTTQGNEEQKVTFLYRLAEGPSPKSYGLNVARLAHLPKEVIELAREKSESFEAFMAQGQGKDGGEGGEGSVHPQLALGAELFVVMVGEKEGSVEEKAAKARALWVEWNKE